MKTFVFILIAQYFNAAKVMHFLIPDKYKIWNLRNKNLFFGELLAAARRRSEDK
jgi:hypothetical protein